MTTTKIFRSELCVILENGYEITASENMCTMLVLLEFYVGRKSDVVVRDYDKDNNLIGEEYVVKNRR